MQSAVLDPVDCLKALIACPSVTPTEGGALRYLSDTLSSLGFATERLVFSEPGTPDVENLFARIGSRPPHVVFVGHTDVVPPGDTALWSHPPFAADVCDGALYGRGAVDMKGGIAAFLAGVSHVLGDAGPPLGTISLMITGDEEGPAINGTAKLLAWALSQGNQFDASLVGEPTCRTQLGDTIKIGRRGSLSGTIRVTGQQGHAAYPHLADNPVPRLIRLVHRLSELQLDQGSEDFQPSNLEVTSIDVGNPAFNVIPSEAGARFNVRFNDHWSVDSLTAFIRSELAEVADGDRFAFEVAGRPSEWFLTRSEALIGPLTAAIGECTGQAPELTTGGGTSDARFFKDVCPVVEFGLVGDTIHQIDERVPIDDLTVLARTYQGFLRHYFSTIGDA